jgi:hypothetical protein
VTAFGVDKEARIGQATARAAHAQLNPVDYSDEAFARTARDRKAQVPCVCFVSQDPQLYICFELGFPIATLERT